MNRLVVFEDEEFRNLLPLTYWRAAWELRVGYGSLLDHLQRSLPRMELTLYCRTEISQVVAERFDCPVNDVPSDDTMLFCNARLLLTSPLEMGPCPAVQWQDGVPIVIAADRTLAERLTHAVLADHAAARQLLADVPEHIFISSPRMVRYPWSLVHANGEMLQVNWKQAGEPGHVDGKVYEGAWLLNRNAIHIGAGSVVKPTAVIDAEDGPVFIGRNVRISPHVTIQGPCYIGDDSIIQPGASIREGTSIGRRCKIGGEVEESIVHAFSNKQHDGFLGHAYVAEWVNLGADTVNSDLKNTYGSVRVPVNGVDIDSGHAFVGLTIGDHSKTGIGQAFPTGAVVGFASNVATAGLAPKFVPSFSWLIGSNRSEYDVQRCISVARQVMARRQVALTPSEEAWFHLLPNYAAQIESSGGDA